MNFSDPVHDRAPLRPSVARNLAREKIHLKKHFSICFYTGGTGCE